MVINTYAIPARSYHVTVIAWKWHCIYTFEILVYSQHVTVVVWRLYHLRNFKLRPWYNTLPNQDCEHGVLYYQIITREFVFWHHLFRYSFRFFAFLLTLHFGFLSVSTYLLRLCASQICSAFTIYRSFLILNWDPHACCGQAWSFITATLVSKYLLLRSRIWCHFSILWNKNA